MRVRWRQEKNTLTKQYRKNKPPGHASPTMPRPLLCLCLLLPWLALATAAVPSLTRWVRGERGDASSPAPSPSTLYTLFSTASSPACAAACALVLLEGDGTGGRVLASASPLRPALVAVAVAVAQGGTSDGVPPARTLQARLRCGEGSGCAPAGPAAAGVGLDLGGGGVVVRDDLPTLVVRGSDVGGRHDKGQGKHQRAGGREGEETLHVQLHPVLYPPPPAAAAPVSSRALQPVLAVLNGLGAGCALAAWRRRTRALVVDT